ncbi:hypothetical protein K504DRAFT_508995 [Pleomassaria siparia CBS 279.74]|uniref:Uncharacterized protein n=1 Tax=Pleomassaria siparia CBS 279.74 TaxID=1314801 RepID=A0A6G1JPN4_9PLEO|nr:hypothetical protein K504DRAFT_508995 [Pleomassaria siparia CBS 279.74]
MPPLPPSREDGDTGDQPLTQGIGPSTVQQNPPEMYQYTTWISFSRVDQYPAQERVQPSQPNANLETPQPASSVGGAVPAFNVGSTHDNAISVTYLLLNILLLACPMADNDGAV